MINSKIFFLRYFVEVRNLEEANQMLLSTKNRLFNYIVESDGKVKQYWKIPEYFECIQTITVLPEKKYEGAFEDICLCLGTGWQMKGSEENRWAIWSPCTTATFFSDKVRWANLETIIQG